MFTLNIANNVTGVLDITRHLNTNKSAPRVLKIESKEVTGITNVPSTIKSIRIEGSLIQSLPRGSIPEGVTTLWMRRVAFKSFTDLNLPESLRTIWCANTSVESFDGLPRGVIDITIHGGTMSSINLLSYTKLKNLSMLGCHKDTQSTNITSLPNRLINLSLKDCNIRKIENVPNSVRCLDLQGNKDLQRIEGLPRDLTRLTLPSHITTLENISRCKNLTSIVMPAVLSIGDHIRNDILIQGLVLNMDRDEISRLTERFINVSSVESQIQECDDTILPSEILSMVQSHNYLDVVDGFVIENDGIPVDVGRELVIVTSLQQSFGRTVKSQINTISAMASHHNIKFTHITGSLGSCLTNDMREYHEALSTICHRRPNVYSITNKTDASFDYMTLSTLCRDMAAEDIITWYKSLKLEDHLTNTAFVV